MDEVPRPAANLSARQLGKLLLMQSVLDSLPDEASIRDFVARGLSEMPGVVAAKIFATAGEMPEQDGLRFQLNLGEVCKGELLLTCRDPAAFQPYADYIRNFCFMVAVIMEERQQRHLRAAQQATLEELVQERTRQLEGEIAERRQMEAQVRKLLADAERGRNELIGILADQKKTEEASRQLAAIVESSDDGIIGSNLAGMITSWNRGAEKIFGYTAAEMIGTSYLRLIPPDRHEEENQTLAKVRHGEGVEHFETVHTARGGRVLEVSVTASPIQDGAGTIVGVSKMVRDVTENKLLEAKFLRSQRMEGIGLLAGGIAHDLNNILTPILISSTLLRDVTRDEDSRHLIDSVATCARRGADIIQQLLTFARGQPGVRAPVPLRHLLGEMDKLIRETFPRNIQLAVALPADLWLVTGDPTQIHQALMNLCVNARDAMPDGGTLRLAAGNVTLDAASAALLAEAKPGHHVRLLITDTGTGIPPEQLEHIFDPFFTTKEIGKGTGLGLPTVLGIVRGHGGAIRVDSQVGRGTTFELYFPATPSKKAADQPEQATSLPTGQGELILVVDDEVTVRKGAQLVLERYGYRVLTANEGAAALELFAQHRHEIKAVLTDMMMPGMDGQKLVRALWHLDPRLPILGMTGLTDRASIKQLPDLGALPLLPKPFEVGKLLVTLHEMIAAKGSAARSVS